ncbi:putative inner membrane protein [Citrobacter koseri]|uniref:Putative inner membrane protein n=1 Tax=Citrobacter koseri TaxID=545 RepID=A0A2X2WF18_CITKO|nr:putative inner membrane protein [Citrobacter koseri]
MVNLRQPRDIAQVLLSVLFLAIMIVACLWIVRPFVLGFAWAGTIVIATWPVLLRLQKILWGRRSLAVLVMTLLLVLLFIIPIALLVNSIVDGSGPLIHAVTAGDMTLPDLAWLNRYSADWRQIVCRVAQPAGYGRHGDHGESASLYWHHHDLVLWVRPRISVSFMMPLWSDAAVQRPCCTGAANRWHWASATSPVVWPRNAAMPPCCWRPRPSAPLHWVWLSPRWFRQFSGGIGLAISGVPYATLLTVVMILSCLVQLGPLPVLIPAIIWLYWTGDTTWGHGAAWCGAAWSVRWIT